MNSYRSIVHRALSSARHFWAGAAWAAPWPVDIADRMNAAPWESGVPMMRSPRLVASRRGPFWNRGHGALWDGHWVLALAMIASLLVLAPGAAAPVRAAPTPDPVARLQVILKDVWIIDNRTLFGSATIDVYLHLCPLVGRRVGACVPDSMDAAHVVLEADTGDTVYLNRVMPGEGDFLYGDPTVESGFPVQSGQSYYFAMDMQEDGAVTHNDMGRIFIILDEEHNWGIGEHRARSLHADGSNGDYDITYEIRPMPLPDLRVRGFDLVQGDGGRQLICAQIENVGALSSTPTALTERVNDTVFRIHTLSEVAPGQTTQECIFRSELPAQAHVLKLYIDEERDLPEMNELNNADSLPIPAVAAAAAVTETTDAAPAAAPSTEPTPAGGKGEPSGERADLTVRSLRVDGQEPDGKSDCKPGPNDVTVVVKNVGKGDAEQFVVRLAVDGTTLDQHVDAVRAGEEREVAFVNVSLKKGEHTLKAIADPDHAVSETNDRNNELKVSVRCTDAA